MWENLLQERIILLHDKVVKEISFSEKCAKPNFPSPLGMSDSSFDYRNFFYSDT